MRPAPSMPRLAGVALTFAIIASCGGNGGNEPDAQPAPTGPVDSVTLATEPSATTDGSAPPTTEPESVAATTVGPTTTAPPLAVQEYGGELVVGGIFDVFGLEPATFVGAVADGHLSAAIYDSLLTYTPTGGTEPWLAESLESVDDMVWTIRLHDDVRFHDGTPLDADSVKVNLDRHGDPDVRSRAANQAREIADVTVLDPLTVEITLQEPWPAFPEMLAGNLGLIASPAAIAAGTVNQQPVGSGPFRFVEHRPGDRVIVERNDDYWRPGEPYLDRIVYRVVLDDAARLLSIETGELHAAQSIRPEVIAEAAADGRNTTTSPGHANTIHLNTQSAPTSDVRVRRALAMAIDYEALNEVVFAGTALGDRHLIAVTNPYHDPSVTFPSFDPDAARALVEEYEAEHGPISFTFRCYNGDTPVRMTQVVEQMWRAVGIDVDVQLSDQTTLVIDMLQGSFSVGCLALGADTFDPDSIYFNQFHSASLANYGKYANDEMDAALEQGRRSTDHNARFEAYSTVQLLLARDTPVIEWARPSWGWIAHPRVTGLVALPGAEFRPSLVSLTSD